MRSLGLTGGIGMGKSAAADWFRGRGVPVVDSDVLARQVVEPGQPALEEIRRAFGSTVISPEGELDRKALAAIVFADPAARQRLEVITHPRIRQLWRSQFETWRAGRRAVVVAVVPLLFEVHAESEFDATICVACSAATQRQRLLVRGWTAEQVEQRIVAQWPAEQKLALADYAVWTEGCLEVLAAQLDRLLARL